MKNLLFRTYEPSDYRTFGLESSHHNIIIINLYFRLAVHTQHKLTKMYRVVRHHFQTFDTTGATEFTIHCMIVLLLDWSRPRKANIDFLKSSPNDKILHWTNISLAPSPTMRNRTKSFRDILLFIVDQKLLSVGDGLRSHPSLHKHRKNCEWKGNNA